MCVLFLGFAVSSISLKRFPAYTEEDFKVLFTLFVFLVIIKGLQLSKLLDYIAVKIERGSFVSLKLVLFSAFISMFITNDVALMVVVPLTLAMRIPDIEKTIILETIAVNGGSVVSPFGNPQNIFIYFHYHVHFFDFIKEIFPLFIFSLMLLVIFIFTPKIKGKVELKGEIPSVNKEGYVYLAFFVLFVVAVLRFLPLWIGVVPVIFSLVFRRETLKIDY
ncbi:SLC13 family permease, partial [Persephonella sp.]